MSPTLASMIEAYPSMMDVLKFSIIGFSVVLFVLVVLSMIMSISGIFFTAFDRASAKLSAPKASAPAASAPASAVAVAETSDAQIVAVIAAAVAVALDGANHRIVSLKMVPSSLSWSREGRLAHYASKNYRPTRK